MSSKESIIRRITKSLILAFVLAILSTLLILTIVSIWAGYRSIVAGDVGLASDFAAYGSSVGTLVLVLVTMWYAYTTRKSVELSNKRISHEIRQRHTETLRQRVNEWLGDYKGQYIDDPFERENSNLPQVYTTRVESAPWDMSPDVLGKNYGFRVFPERLEGDRYLQDFLENHAPDVADLKETIEERHKEYLRLKGQFERDYDDTEIIDSLSFEARPGKQMEEWAFERCLMLERGDYTMDDLKEIAEDVIDGETWADEHQVYYPGGRPNITAVIVCDRENEEREQVINAIKQTIDRLDQHSSYEIAREAATTMDRLDEDIKKLRDLLIEYKGRPVYIGDCQYIDEAGIETETLFEQILE